MFVRKILTEESLEVIKPTTISKMLLCEDSINSFLKSFSTMKNLKTIYTDELLESHRKYNIYKNIIENLNFIKVDGWEGKPDNVVGPYLNNRELYFFHKDTDITCVCTYFPLHSLKKNEINNRIIREIKFYVFDNFNLLNQCPDMVNVVSTLKMEDLKSHRSLTTRYTIHSKNIFKISKTKTDKYHWNFIEPQINNDVEFINNPFYNENNNPNYSILMEHETIQNKDNN